MNSSDIVSSFPNMGVVERIHSLPQATHDVSRFIKMTPEEIATELSGQTVSLNIANADPSEVTKFEQVNALLREKGQPEISLFGKEVEGEIAAINHEILEAVLDRARNAFKEFLAKVDAAALIEEYNTYIAPRQQGFDEIHSWGNIGVTDKDDPIRRRVIRLLDDVASDNENLINEALSQFEENSSLGTEQEKIRAILLSMMSNFVRGIFYNHQNSQKVANLRKVAVDTFNEVGEDGLWQKFKTRLAKFFGL